MKLPVKYDSLQPRERRQVREEYVELQNGICMYCGSRLDKDPPDKILSKPIDLTLFPKGFLTYPVHLQHCHKTGLTEGAVHAYCNAVLWEYEEDGHIR